MAFLSCFRMLIPVICLASNVILQITAMRTVPNIGLLKSIFLSFFFGITCLMLLEFFTFIHSGSTMDGFIYSFTANLITYIALGYCYFHFLNLGETARRIRIIRELYDSPDGLSMEDMLNRYNAKIIIGARIKRLIDNRQIILKDGRYYVGLPVVLFMAKFMLLMKSLILGRQTNSVDSIN